jgi:hypothetical protein
MLRDSLYLELKKKSINDMSEREYDYFMKMRNVEIQMQGKKAKTRAPEIKKYPGHRAYYKDIDEDEDQPKKRRFAKGCMAFSLVLMVSVPAIIWAALQRDN